jgi:hypothetical protein
VRGFWARGTDCILDVGETNTDAKSQHHKNPDKVLAQHEREKKRKYLEPCLKQQRHFTPFVVSTGGLLGKEAPFFIRRLSSILSEKWHQPYSVVCGFVKSRMIIAIARARHLCLPEVRGSPPAKSAADALNGKIGRVWDFTSTPAGPDIASATNRNTYVPGSLL